MKDPHQDDHFRLCCHAQWYLDPENTESLVLSDGDSHNKYDMPVLLAGSLGGKLKIDGRHISYTQMSFPRPLLGPKGGPNTEHTFVSLLNAFDIPDQAFGDAKVSGPNTAILA